MLICIQSIQDASDRSLVEKLYNQYSSTMLYIAQSILKDQYRAEDAVEQAFIKIIDNLQKFSFENCNKTKGLVVIIVRNISYSMIKEGRHEKILPLEDLDNSLGQDENVPLNHVVSEESYDLIMECLSVLIDTYKDILRLKLIYEYSDDEIAKILDITPGNVRVRFSRAKKALITEMEKRENVNE